MPRDAGGGVQVFSLYEKSLVFKKTEVTTLFVIFGLSTILRPSTGYVVKEMSSLL